MNTLTLIGTLTRDPELRMKGDNKVCAMRLAESKGRKGSPLFINVAAFGPQADSCMQSLYKGSQLAVIGQLRFREWKADDGSRRFEHSIAAERLDFLATSSPDRDDLQPSDANATSTETPTPPGKLKETKPSWPRRWRRAKVAAA